MPHGNKFPCLYPVRRRILKKVKIIKEDYQKGMWPVGCTQILTIAGISTIGVFIACHTEQMGEKIHKGGLIKLNLVMMSYTQKNITFHFPNDTNMHVNISSL